MESQRWSLNLEKCCLRDITRIDPDPRMSGMVGTGVSKDTIVEQVFRDVRALRIYDGPTEVHKWSLANKIKRDQLQRPHP